MADWAKPTISSNYLEVLALLGARDTDAATQFATGTPENTPVGAVKFSRTARRWEAWNGEAWAPLAAKYAISIDGDAAGAPWAGITGKPDAFTPAAHSHAASELAALLGSATPKPSAATASAGTAAKAAREDHAHQLPANATQSAAGLMSAADKAALDALPGQVSAADAKATAAASTATAADGKATEAKSTADAAKLTADGLAANVNAVDVKATNAAGAAANAHAAADAAQNTANAAKSSADSSVKTVNWVAPVGGNVSIPVPSADTPQSNCDAIGAYAMLIYTVLLNQKLTIGKLVSGLPYAAVDSSPDKAVPAGTWRAHCQSTNGTTNTRQVGIFQRIA